MNYYLIRVWEKIFDSERGVNDWMVGQFDSEEEAVETARSMAFDLIQSYEGVMDMLYDEIGCIDEKDMTDKQAEELDRLIEEDAIIDIRPITEEQANFISSQLDTTNGIVGVNDVIEWID